jgi:putative ABC transport system permease protein
MRLSVTSGSVPLARRQLAHEPLKLFLALLGVTLAVALVGLLFALREGIRHQVTTYVDNAGAEIYVAPRDTRSFVTGGPPALRASLTGELARTPGVAEAGAVVASLGILRLHDKRVATLLVGFEPGRLGRPWKLSEGRAPRHSGEIALDRVMAGAHELEPGDTVTVRGRHLRVVGLTDKTASWMTPLTFVTRREAAAMAGEPRLTSFVLLRGDGRPTVRLVEALKARFPTLNVMTRGELAANDRDLMARSFNSPLLVMVLIALGVGALVIAITTYGFVSERRREFGSLKAIGARNGRLYRVVSVQALAIATIALAAGVAMEQGAASAIEALWPKFLFVTLPSHYVLVVIAALLMALVGALVPARVLARLDPAEVFRR